MSNPRIVLITGPRQVGKTTVCQRLETMLKDEALTVSGLITLRTGPHDLRLVELASGQSYSLTLPFDQNEGIDLKNFRMRPEAMARGRKALEASFPTQVFILDELGPLELIRGQGWHNACRLLKDAVYHVAFVVVRPELLTEAVLQLPAEIYYVVKIEEHNRDKLPTSLYQFALVQLGGNSP